MKTCFKCKENKELSFFYKHSRMGDGHLNKCKACTKKDTNRNRKDNLDYYLAYDRARSMLPHRKKLREEYAKTKNGKIVDRKSKQKWLDNNKEKRKAQQKVNNAIRDGSLKKHPCIVCGSIKRIHGHHDDYSKPLDVVWLCPLHHCERHKELRRAGDGRGRALAAEKLFQK